MLFKKSLDDKFFLFFSLSFFLILKLILFQKGIVFFDEGVYVGISKYFASMGKIGYFEAIRPLALPFFLIPFQLVKINPLIFGRVLVMFLTLICFIIFYYLVKRNFNKIIAIWSTLFLITSPSFLIYSGYILNDVLSYLIALFAFLVLKDKLFLSGLLLSLAFLFKFPAVLMIFPLLINILMKKENTNLLSKKFNALFKFFLGNLCLLFPYFLFNFFKYSGNFFQKILFPLLQASNFINNPTWVYQKSSFFLYLKLLFSIEIILTIFFLIGLFFLIKEKKTNLQIKILLFSIFIFLSYFSFKVYRFDPRYIISIIPILCLFAGYGVYKMLKKSKKFIFIFIFLLFLTSFLTISYVFMLKSISHENEITNYMSSFESNSIITTNSALVPLYYHTKVNVIPGSNLVFAYNQYYLNNQSEEFVIDLNEYECPPNDLNCVNNFNLKLNKILSSNNIQKCGFWHGRKIIILNKNESLQINREECLKKLNFTYENVSQTNIKFRLNDAILGQDGKFIQEKNLINLINILETKNLSYIFVLNSNNKKINNTSFINSLNGKIGVLETQKNNALNFSFEFNKKFDKNITIFVPEGDDWGSNYFSNYSIYESCIKGSWDQTVQNINCETVSLYVVKNWSSGEFYPVQTLFNKFVATNNCENNIIIDLPVYLLNDKNYQIITSFINHSNIIIKK